MVAATSRWKFMAVSALMVAPVRRTAADRLLSGDWLREWDVKSGGARNVADCGLSRAQSAIRNRGTVSASRSAVGRAPHRSAHSLGVDAGAACVQPDTGSALSPSHPCRPAASLE